MEFTDLKAIVDFLYYGEVNIYQENIDNFLNLADELKLKGLNGEGSNTNQEESDLKEQGIDETITQGTERFDNPMNIPPNQNRIKQKKLSLDRTVEKCENYGYSEMAVALPKEEFSGDLQELDQKVRSMMVLGQNKIADGKQRASVCQICGKEGKTNLIKDHIEANHIDGITIPCNLCEKTYRSRASLRNHKLQQHKIN